ncbi:MAG: hypothetical protein GMKNLPBB_02462 [Myxococcota bacterium]|nr:hypothetical protein [Myxococcota bacterium]
MSEQTKPLYQLKNRVIVTDLTGLEHIGYITRMDKEGYDIYLLVPNVWKRVRYGEEDVYLRPYAPHPGNLHY